MQIEHHYSIEKKVGSDKKVAKLTLGPDTFSVSSETAWEAKKKAAAKALMETTFKFSHIPGKFMEFSSKGEESPVQCMFSVSASCLLLKNVHLGEQYKNVQVQTFKLTPSPFETAQHRLCSIATAPVNRFCSA